MSEEKKEGEQEEKPKLNKIEIRILEYLKSVPIAQTSSVIAFHIQANYLYTGKYLKHLEELGYIELDKNLTNYTNRSYWKLKQEKLEDDPNNKR